MKKFIVTFTFIILFVTMHIGCCRAAEDGGLFERHPWLRDASPLRQNINFETGAPSRTQRGAIGVGNGRAFGLIGLDVPQNTLSNLIGPDYETSETFFGPVSHSLEISGKPCDTSKSALYRVRYSNIVVVEEACPFLTVTTVTFAPPGSTTILRLITISNQDKSGSAGAVEDAALVVNAGKKDDKPETAGATLTFENKGDIMTVGFADGSGVARDGVIIRQLGRIAAGENVTLPLYIDFSLSEKPTPLKLEIPDPDALLETTYHEWINWFDGTLSVESSNARLADFFENTLVLLKSQEAAGNGAVAVMARYSGAWCRDAYSPIRFYLLSGKFNEARAIASFYDYATRLHGFGNRYPVDLDLSTAPESFDWNKLSPQQGDDPNILILHIYNVWRVTGDDNFIREHYGFMRRNLTGQFNDNCRLPFHGDETYQVYVMLQSKSPMKDFYTVDTNFWHVTAAEALSEMAAAIGENDDAAAFAERASFCRGMADQYYWNDEDGYYIPYVKKDTLEPADSPFADIGLHPLWIGYADAGDPKQRRSIITTAKKLMNKQGTMKTSSRVGQYTGMLPGYLLYNLKAIGLMDRADIAYNGLFNRAMSPTGEFGEAYGDNDRWLDYTVFPNVLRPWETAINAEAVLYYITGLHYDNHSDRVTLQPHTPPGVDSISFKNLFAGPHRVSVSLEKIKNKTTNIEVINTGDKAFEVELILEPGLEKEEGVESFESAAYNRTLWRKIQILKPGESATASGAVYGS